MNGIVQGVGFRPFVFRLASRLGLTGFVRNDSTGVIIEIEGDRAALEVFVCSLPAELPPLARITGSDSEHITPVGDSQFKILASGHDESATTLISPDIAVCDDCLIELFDPGDRRFRYPFTNCTNCGPRYTIVKSIPYDRPNTSMSVFPLCEECAREYHDPANRRFHAQPNACPKCGPKLRLVDRSGALVEGDPLNRAVQLLKGGHVVAIRGVGGFHLAVDAHHEQALLSLRLRKGRAEKPFALMAPDIDSVKRYCHVSPEEERFLRHYTHPILLLRSRDDNALPNSVAPGQNYIGFMLPYTPLHHLLMRDNFDSLVMTSGNFSEEPIAIANDEALERLSNLADYFLLHDREILQRCDDSIARIASGDPRIIRRSRGFVPGPVLLARPTEKKILAVGGELKNAIALSRGRTVFLSQHIGDLDNPSAMTFFTHSIAHLERILELKPEAIAHDLHPEYLSTKWALEQQGLTKIGVQHHHAHLASVMADNLVSEKTIGIILDGTGYGLDGTLWGGEVLIGDFESFRRFAWLEPVPMPGGAQAILQPWRMALSYLYLVYGDDLPDLDLPLMKSISRSDCDVIVKMIGQLINSPLTSGCGRLFDGIAALLQLKQEVSYEAQAAMLLEMAVGQNSARPGDIYSDALIDDMCEHEMPLTPLIAAVVADIKRGVDTGRIAARFHQTLVEMFVRVAIGARDKSGIDTVGLSGGVFQNVYFFELMVNRLRREEFTVLSHKQVPTNDGGLALGQIVIADAVTRPRSAD